MSDSPFPERPASVDLSIRVTFRVYCNNGKTNEQMKTDLEEVVRSMFEERIPVGPEHGVESLHIEANALVSENVYIRPDNGRRQCRACNRERQRKHAAS